MKPGFSFLNVIFEFLYLDECSLLPLAWCFEHLAVCPLTRSPPDWKSHVGGGRMGLTLRLCQGPAVMSGTEAAFGSPFSQLPMQLLESFLFLNNHLRRRPDHGGLLGDPSPPHLCIKVTVSLRHRPLCRRVTGRWWRALSGVS